MSDRAFASLTPANALAKLAFSEVFDTLTLRRQAEETNDISTALDRMLVKPQQRSDSEIVHLLREAERMCDNDAEASESLTEPDTDTEATLQALSMIWVGSYELSLEPPPEVPERGWSAGKVPVEWGLHASPGKMPIDLPLCTRSFAKSHNINLRNPHARFNFFLNNKGFYISGCSRSPSTQLTVNGDGITRTPYHLNQYEMKIQFGNLEYWFKWTDFAATEDFLMARELYVDQVLGLPSTTLIDVDMPTPLPSKRTIGKWTLGKALGKGTTGRVFFASDPAGNSAAIKVVERTWRNRHTVAAEIETLQEVTKLSQSSEDGELVLRMADVIYTNGEEFSSTTAFDNVAIVLVPITPRIFNDLIGPSSKR